MLATGPVEAREGWVESGAAPKQGAQRCLGESWSVRPGAPSYVAVSFGEEHARLAQWGREGSRLSGIGSAKTLAWSQHQQAGAGREVTKLQVPGRHGNRGRCGGEERGGFCFGT